jgi:serine/threonine-protein kinase
LNDEANRQIRRIGRYEVLTLLQMGGMAELYLACVFGPGGFRKFVAVKRILPSLRHEEEFIAMFLDEARISAALSHSNIAQVFDLAEEDGELYIAMEYVAGQDVSRIVRAVGSMGKRLPIGFSAALVRDACTALHYAHHFTSPSGRQLPVIHRDLTLRNIMVTYTGTTKLVDFGIAKARGSIATTQAGRVKGSVAYMSPEQIRGEELTGRSDIFSAGVVLHELLVGKRLFSAVDDAATMHQVLNVDPVAPHKVSPDVPEALSDVVMQALQKSPDRRFESAGAMARAIEDATGRAIFREEGVAAWMADHFADSMTRTREMFALAGDVDAAKVAEAASSLKELNTPPVMAKSGSAPNSEARTLSELRPKPGTILAVDDTRVGRMLVETVLAHDGHRVVTAANGAEALEVLAQMKPDLVVLDINMPGMDGFELCRQIRSKENMRATPIIFLSAQCSLAERQKGLQVGGDDFLRKPFEAGELASRVRLHLKRAQSLSNSSGNRPAVAVSS